MKWFVFLITAFHPSPRRDIQINTPPLAFVLCTLLFSVSCCSLLSSVVLIPPGSFSSSCPYFFYSSLPPALSLSELSSSFPFSLPATVKHASRCLGVQVKILPWKQITGQNDGIDCCRRWPRKVFGESVVMTQWLKELGKFVVSVANSPWVYMCALSLTAGWQAWEGHLQILSSLCKGQTVGCCWCSVMLLLRYNL